MRQTLAIGILLIGTFTFAACGKKQVAPPPAPPPATPAPPPPAPPPTPPAPAPRLDNEYDRLKSMSSHEIDRLVLLADIHFDYDKSDIREGDRTILNKNAEVLKKFDFIRVTVEGHCDERGTVEYNLA